MTERWHAEMRWEDVLFVHWPVDPDAIAPRVPDSLALDVRDGRAWLSVVALVMADVGPPGLARGYTFPEVNLRTYVSADEPAVYFFSIEAAEPIGTLAGRLLGRASAGNVRPPYHRARVSLKRDDGGVSVESERRPTDDRPATFAAAAQLSDEPAFTPSRGSIPSFLMDRHRFYAPVDEGSGVDAEPTALTSGTVAHGPWRLRPASITVLRDGLFAAAELPVPTTEPVAYYCSAMPSVAARIDRRLTKS